ncbi:hypothetical protein [Motilimonas eburnea]|uniref:hypothetical protein n=1 Tax=Motilimonas eburnea TaxID=1737488 RepID=UPI001E4C5440|nr:hypothetical protein [Motilimonas eburnea]MCE2570778.1 hypothetical protein [Motilimonas eburnea]
MCWRKLAVLTSAILLSACGGGGSDLSGGDDGGGTVPSTAPTIAPTPEPLPYSINLQLLDCNDVAGGWDRTVRNPDECTATTSVTSTKPAIVYVAVTDTSGNPIAEHVVSGDSTLGELKPDSKTALTDANGIAILDLQAGTVSGAGTVTVSTLSGDSVQSDASKGFQVSVGDIDTDAPVTLEVRLLNCPDDWDRVTRDADLCSETTEVKSSAPAILYVTASQGNSPVANKLFSASTTLGEITPALTALTNANGIGILDLEAGSTDGAGRATIQIDINGEVTSTAIDYAIGIDGITSEQNVNINLTILACPENWDRTIRDPKLCQETVDVATGKPVVLYIQLLQGKVPLASQVVSGETTLGILKPEVSKTALTDGNGVALLDLYAGDTDGAGIVTVKSSALGAAASTEKGFNVGVSDIQLNVTTSLEANEEAQQNSTVLITATVTEESGELFNVPLQINFSSRCTSTGDAVIDASSFTVNGVATATYKPTACVDQDIITVEAPANNLIKDVTVDIAATKAQSIRFIKATPDYIAIKGTGGAGRQETSEVSFKLVDQNGNPARQQMVRFSLETFPVGTSISPMTAQTNNEGIVSTVVESGEVNGVVRVKANYDIKDQSGNFIKTISSVSDQLTVSTGLPEQSSVSLAFSQRILDGWTLDGNTTQVTIRLGDIFNNDVPDGTAVSFVTEGGRIGSSGQGSCTTTDSTCTVTLTTQNPRPPGNKLQDFSGPGGCAAYSFGDGVAPCINPGGMGQPYGGRVTVTAFAVGEETFFDNKPANGQFDKGETFHDLHEVIYDYNEDGLYQQLEVAKRSHNPDTVVSDTEYAALKNAYLASSLTPVTGEDDNETWHEFDQKYLDSNDPNNPFDRPSPGNNLYNGTLCTLESESNGLCSREFVEVSNSAAVIFATNKYYIRAQAQDPVTKVWYDTESISLCKTDCSDSEEQPIKMRFWIADEHNNPPVSGGVIKVETNNGRLLSDPEIAIPDTVRGIDEVSPHPVLITITPEAVANGTDKGIFTLSLEVRQHTSLVEITVIDKG